MGRTSRGVVLQHGLPEVLYQVLPWLMHWQHLWPGFVPGTQWVGAPGTCTPCTSVHIPHVQSAEECLFLCCFQPGSSSSAVPSPAAWSCAGFAGCPQCLRPAMRGSYTKCCPTSFTLCFLRQRAFRRPHGSSLSNHKRCLQSLGGLQCKSPSACCSQKAEAGPAMPPLLSAQRGGASHSVWKEGACLLPACKAI